jgi:hypothetical protein
MKASWISRYGQLTKGGPVSRNIGEELKTNQPKEMRIARNVVHGPYLAR